MRFSFSRLGNLHSQLANGKFRYALSDWGVVLAGLIAERGLITLAMIVVARLTSDTEYGQYLSSTALLSLLVVLPNFGIDTWLLTEGRLDRSRAAGFWWSAFRVRLGTLLVWGVAAALIGSFLPKSTFPAVIYYPTLITVGADSLTLLALFALRSAGAYRPVTLLQVVPALSLLGVTLLLQLQPGHIGLFSLTRAVVSVIVLVFTLAVTRLMLPVTKQRLSPVHILKEARPFLWGDLATAIYLRADLTIVSLILGTAGSKLYGPALNITNMTFLAPNALYFVVVPALARAVQRSRQSFIQIGSLQLVVQLLSGVALAAGLILFAEPVVFLIFGSNYAGVPAILRLLGPILVVKSLNFGLAAILVTTQRQEQRARVQAISATFNVIANLAVILPYGLPGVAVVYILSEVILLVGYSWIAFQGYFAYRQQPNT